MGFLFQFFKDNGGAVSVEYSVMLALILMAVLAAVGLVGAESGAMWGEIATSIATE